MKPLMLVDLVARRFDLLSIQGEFGGLSVPSHDCDYNSLLQNESIWRSCLSLFMVDLDF